MNQKQNLFFILYLNNISVYSVKIIMTTKEVIELGKKIILLAGVKWKVSKTEGEKLLLTLNETFQKLKGSSSKYAPKILEFIHDLRGDIIAWRELNIDGIKNDEYIENYFIASSEAARYNWLIQETLYEKIILNLRNEKIDEKALKKDVKLVSQNFNSEYKKLSAKNIAKHLLIFSLFEIKKPQKALKNMYILLKDVWCEAEIQVIQKMFLQVSKLKQQVKVSGIGHYKKSSFTTKYMEFIRDEQKITSEVLDASIQGFRSGDKKEEYKRYLRRL